MLQHLLCFLCPCQASDQRQELGREAARKGHSGRMLVASLSIRDSPKVEGHLLPVPQRFPNGGGGETLV